MPGKDNRAADVLSRCPLCDPLHQGEDKSSPVIAAFTVTGTALLRKKLKKLTLLQQTDHFCQKVSASHLGSGKNSSLADNFLQYNGILLRRNNVKDRNYRVVLPQSLTEEIISYYHQEMGHFGAGKVLSVVRAIFFWPNMGAMTKKILATCEVCQKSKHPNLRPEGPWQNILTKSPGDLVAIDFFGPLPVSKGAYPTF